MYAGVLNKAKRFEEGEKVARQAVDMDRRLHGDQHPETAWGLRALGIALQAQQKLDEAEPVFRESLTIFRRFYADDHVYVQWVVDMLKTVLEARGDKSALESLAKEEAEQASRSDSPDYQFDWLDSCCRTTHRATPNKRTRPTGSSDGQSKGTAGQRLISRTISSSDEAADGYRGGNQNVRCRPGFPQ